MIFFWDQFAQRTSLWIFFLFLFSFSFSFSFFFFLSSFLFSFFFLLFFFSRPVSFLGILTFSKDQFLQFPIMGFLLHLSSYNHDTLYIPSSRFIVFLISFTRPSLFYLPVSNRIFICYMTLADFFLFFPLISYPFSSRFFYT